MPSTRGAILMNISYDILIPAYNAQRTLPDLLRQIQSLKSAPQHIFVVDDGSTDRTAEVIGQAGVTLLQNAVNRGKGHALRRGFRLFMEQSDSAYLLCLDADLQHPPHMAADFLAQARSGVKIVIGRRKRSPQHMPLMRIVSNTLTSAILSLLLGQKIHDSQCGYRLIERSVLEEIQLTEDGFQLETEFIIESVKRGHSIRFVPIPTIYNHQDSYINHLGDTLRFIKLVWNKTIRRR